MDAEVTIRPLLPDDVAAAEAVAWAALSPLWPEEVRPVDDDVRRVRARARVAHLQATDPDGAWVAVAGDAVVGLALALVREGVWGLSLFGIDEAWQGRGVARRLLAPTLAYASGPDVRGGIILSSVHPGAMRTYATAGFALRPCVAVCGVLDRRGLPAGLGSRPGSLEDAADVETCRAASRIVRGASHERDLPRLLEAGRDLLVLPGRGFAVHADGSPALLAAVDEEAAADLLASCFAAAPPGATVHADFITAGNDWAIAVALRCRLALSPDGPVFVRGTTGTFAPYLPSGAYL